MEFITTPREDMFRMVLREFAEKEVAPIAAEIDESGRFPRETVTKMGKLGIMGLSIPTKYGGTGADTCSYCIAVEEISRACAATGIILSAHVSVCAQPIYMFGNEEQKEKYLPSLCSGKKLGAISLTEPNAGSDASNQQTLAVKDGDAYVLNGTKIFVTNGGEADIYLVFANTNPAAGLKGISCFIVEKETPGLFFGKKENKMGIRASATTELVFQDCRIPVENLVDREGEGFSIAMQTLNGGRISIGAQAVGVAQACLDEALRYAKERKQFNQAIADFQGIQWMLADMATHVEMARLLVYHAAWLKDNKKQYSKESAMAKLVGAETAMQLAVKAVQIHGGNGYMKEYKVERLMRDAKILEIYEGTSEVQRMIIASRILK